MKPADFPLGSHHSRAAARKLLTEKMSVYERREVIIGNGRTSPHATEWHFNTEGHIAARVISIPVGITLEKGLRALGGYSESQLAQTAKFHPEALDSGTMLMLKRQIVRC